MNPRYESGNPESQSISLKTKMIPRSDLFRHSCIENNQPNVPYRFYGSYQMEVEKLHKPNITYVIKENINTITDELKNSAQSIYKTIKTTSQETSQKIASSVMDCIPSLTSDQCLYYGEVCTCNLDEKDTTI
jgi:hypothetical protein